MKEEVRKLLEKANRALRAADLLRQGGDAESAAGRAYYAMFYAAEALLREKGLRFRKHGGVHGAFGEHFVKNGPLDPKLHRWFLDAFDRRIQADYEVDALITTDDVARTIEQAREFVQAARDHLARQG